MNLLREYIRALLLETVEEEVKEIKNRGLKSIILFGTPSKKDNQGKIAYDKNGIYKGNPY